MRVRYTMPVRGTLQLHDDGVISFPEMVVRFIANEETGYVERFELEVLNVAKENWPTLLPVTQNPNAKIPKFPFDVNPNAVQFSTFVPQIINLESLLSVVGLEAIDVASVAHEWIVEPGDEQIGIFQGMKPLPSSPEAFAHPVSNASLARVITAASGHEKETAGLAHFRAGHCSFKEARYIDAIRDFYLSIEYLFAKGHHSKKQTLAAFNDAPELLSSIAKTLSSTPPAKSALSRLAEKYPALTGAVTSQAFLEWFFHLRGNIQHGNPKSPNAWHPSRQRDFEDESVLVLNVVYDVCWQLAAKRVNAV